MTSLLRHMARHEYLALGLLPVASLAMEHWGTSPAPSTSNNFILVHFSVNLTVIYPSIV